LAREHEYSSGGGRNWFGKSFGIDHVCELAAPACNRTKERNRMRRAVSANAPDLRQGMQEAYAVNERMNQLVLQYLDPRAWRAQIPGGKTRTVAAIFAHVHNVRCKWIRLSAPHLKPPPLLNRTRCTQEQVKRALAESAALCSQMLAEALAPEGRVTKFHRDGWARPWEPGAAMLAYMITHEAHHRGQVCMVAHQLGFKLPVKVTAEMWSWEKCGGVRVWTAAVKRMAFR
jgi:uncharacterized damage-inducible protein DinB